MSRNSLFRIVFAVGLALLVGCGLWVASELPNPPPPVAEMSDWRPVAVEATPVASGVADDRIGELVYRAGFSLTSPDEAFGGFSGLLVDPSADDGARLVAVSDKGSWWRAALRFDDDGLLVGVDDSSMAPLADFGGGPVQGRMRNDAEELARLEGGGLLVSFEGGHRIHAYDAAGSREPRRHPAPPAIVEAGENEGMEAVTRLADGRLVVIAEDLRNDAGHGRGWVREGQDWREMALVLDDADGGFLPTAATTLPDGDILLLTRFYHPAVGVRGRLSRISLAALERALDGGEALRPEELARFAPPVPVDNFEAVDALEDDDGRTWIYLLSDDNFRESQRTLLLQLELRRQRSAGPESACRGAQRPPGG